MVKNLQYPVRTLIGVTAIISSIAASIWLIFLAASQGTVWHVVSFSIYGLSLITLWTFSTLYHTLNVSIETKNFLEQLDHAMIYFLIAGTYTPICLVVLQGGWGWSLFGINWALALMGIVLKMTYWQPSKGTNVLLFALYLSMGWLIVVAFWPLVNALSLAAVGWLVLGGVFYSVGAVIYKLKRLRLFPQFGYHEIWHLFVCAGCFCHYWLMVKYVLLIR